MEISANMSALQYSMNGMQSAQNMASKASQQIASASSSGETEMASEASEPNSNDSFQSLTYGLIGLNSAKTSFQANAKAFSTSSQMIGTLINTKV